MGCHGGRTGRSGLRVISRWIGQVVPDTWVGTGEDACAAAYADVHIPCQDTYTPKIFTLLPFQYHR